MPGGHCDVVCRSHPVNIDIQLLRCCCAYR